MIDKSCQNRLVHRELSFGANHPQETRESEELERKFLAKLRVAVGRDDYDNFCRPDSRFVAIYQRDCTVTQVVHESKKPGASVFRSAADYRTRPRSPNRPPQPVEEPRIGLAAIPQVVRSEPSLGRRIPPIHPD